MYNALYISVRWVYNGIMPTTTSDYTIMVADGIERSSVPTGEANDIAAALDCAWALQRHTEAAVGIWDNRDGTPRKVAVLSLEWLDGE